MEHHSANQFLKAATNLNVVQPKLFQGSRQDDLRFADCTVSVIQILDDADAAFRILGAGLRTVLSVTTMFADKPHRLNGRMRAAILCFDDLASGYRTRGWATRAAGYRAAISCVGTFRTSQCIRRMSAVEGTTDVLVDNRCIRPIAVNCKSFEPGRVGLQLPLPSRNAVDCKSENSPHVCRQLQARRLRIGHESGPRRLRQFWAFF